MSPFMQRAYAFYSSRGYQPHQAAALAANAQAESGGVTTIKGDGGKAVGIFQWHPDRQANLFGFAKSQGLDPYAENTQLAFKDWEFNNTERRAGDMLRGATDYKSATNAVLASLRPQGYTRSTPENSHNYEGRYNLGAGLVGIDPSTFGSPAGDGTDVMPMKAPTAAPTSLFGDLKQDDLMKAGLGLLSQQGARQQSQNQELAQLYKMAAQNPARAVRPRTGGLLN
jgi:hypothetical protein